jgi:hypothetical protein
MALMKVRSSKSSCLKTHSIPAQIQVSSLPEILYLTDFCVLCDWESRLGYDGRTDRSGDQFGCFDSMYGYAFADIDRIQWFGMCRDMFMDTEAHCSSKARPSFAC